MTGLKFLRRHAHIRAKRRNVNWRWRILRRPPYLRYAHCEGAPYAFPIAQIPAPTPDLPGGRGAIGVTSLSLYDMIKRAP